MKKVFTILFFLTVCFVFSSKENIIDNDIILKKISLNIPEGWSIKVGNDKIIFEKQGEVYSLFENMTNAPVNLETEEEKNQRIKKFGIKTKTKIVYKFESLWKGNKINESKIINKKIFEQINSLLKKYKIEHLYDDMLSSKDDDFFNEGTADENKRIEEYKKEKQKLLDKIIRLPDFDTEKYSLFFMEGTGYNDIDKLVYPKSASEEAYKVLNVIRTTCKEIN